jgi:hypothetical protein
MPAVLTGCTLSGESFPGALSFGISRLIPIAGSPTYWHYSLREDKPTTVQMGGSDTVVLQGDLTLVPVGNALGEFKCTETHSFSPQSQEQTCGHNMYRLQDRVSKEFCSNVAGVKRDAEVSLSSAVLVCPRDFN